MAAVAFVVDGTLGGNHLVPAASAHVGHFHVHAHSHAQAHSDAAVPDHQLVNGGLVADTDVAAHQDGSSPASAPDADAICNCPCACCAAVLLPCLNAQAVPLLLIRDVAFTYRRHGDGIVPEGLRRPPRPLSIA